MKYSPVIFYLLIAFSLITPSSYSANILVIESYHAQYPWDKGYKKGLTETLSNEHTISFFEMDTKRKPKSDYLTMADLAWQTYLEVKPDIVVLGDDNALSYLGPKLKDTDTPTVYLGINNNPRNYPIEDAINITGVLERPLLKRSLLLIDDIIPQIRKVLVLFDSGTTSNVALQSYFDGQNIIKIGNIEVEIALIEQYSLWQSKVDSAHEYGFEAIIIGLYQTLRDKEQNHIKGEEVLTWTSDNSPVPLFGFWDFSIGKDKALGGLVLESYHQGATAAQIINEIIAGTPPRRIRPRIAEKGRFIFSKSQVEKYQLTIPASISKAATWVE